MQKLVSGCVAGRSVLCAVSGGVDSVVLLHLLVQSGVRVIAAHVEHGIRGENSMRDCDFVVRLCAQWHVPLVTAHIDVPGQAHKAGRGLEEMARQLRYDFLRQQKEKLGLDVIATAHHLNDQAETILMHMVRGASPAGLVGMKPESDGLIRPLLSVSRSEIEAYAQEHGLEYVQDETNLDTSYTRNYIRYELLPGMKKVNPRTVEALGRLAELSRMQNDYIVKEAQRVLRQRMHGAALEDVRDVHPGLRGAVLHEYLITQGVRDVARTDIERLEALFALPAGRRASIGKILFERDSKGIGRVYEKMGEVCIPLLMGCNDTPLGSFTLEVVPVPENLNLGKYVQILDADKAGTSLTVRTRRDGDRVHLMGSAGSRLLSDVMTDRKIPRAMRDFIPLIEREGEIIWIAGVAPCAPCAIGSGSVRALRIQYKEKKTKE